jgi:TolA-binding protein
MDFPCAVEVIRQVAELEARIQTANNTVDSLRENLTATNGELQLLLTALDSKDKLHQARNGGTLHADFGVQGRTAPAGNEHDKAETQRYSQRSHSCGGKCGAPACLTIKTPITAGRLLPLS